MKCRIIVPFIATLALCASAAMAQDAQPSPPATGAGPMAHGAWHMNKEEFAEHHAQMCSDIAPRAIGKLAYLEAKLALTDKQKPLFDRWKDVRLANVKARSAECASMTMPDKEFSIVEHLKQEEKMLQGRLGELRAEMPALEALAASLNDEQKHVFDRTHGMFGGHEMHGMPGMMEYMHHGHGDGHDNDDDAPPPPTQ